MTPTTDQPDPGRPTYKLTAPEIAPMPLFKTHDSLENADWMDHGLILRGPEADAMCADLLKTIDAQSARQRNRKAEDKQRFLQTLAVILANLLWTSERDPKRFVKYRRATKAFTRSVRYQDNAIPYRLAMQCIDTLGRLFVIDHATGYQSFQGNRGKVSRMRAGEALLRMAAFFGVSCAEHLHYEPGEGIILKTRDAKAPRGGAGKQAKKRADYVDTPAIQTHRSRLTQWNAFMAAVEIGGPEDIVEALGGPAALRTRRTLRRIFFETFEGGGRYAGGFWLGGPQGSGEDSYSMTKVDRLELTLEGERLVELDLAANAARLVYRLAGLSIPQPFDPYTVPGISRKGGKVMFQRMLAGVFSKPRSKWKPSDAESEEMEIGTGLTYADTVQAMLEAHTAILDQASETLWANIQFLESQIMEATLEALRQKGIPALPVHDALMVPQSKEQEAGRLLKRCYAEVVTDGEKIALDNEEPRLVVTDPGGLERQWVREGLT